MNSAYTSAKDYVKKLPWWLNIYNVAITILGIRVLFLYKQDEGIFSWGVWVLSILLILATTAYITLYVMQSEGVLSASQAKALADEKSKADAVAKVAADAATKAAADAKLAGDAKIKADAVAKTTADAAKVAANTKATDAKAKADVAAKAAADAKIATDAKTKADATAKTTADAAAKAKATADAIAAKFK